MKLRSESASGISKRQLVRGLLVTAIAAVAKPSDLLATPGYEHLPIRPRDLQYFQSLFTDRRVLADFRERPTLQNLGKVARVLARTSTAWVRPIERAYGQVHSGARVLRNEDGEHVGNGTVLRVFDTRQPSGVASYRYVLVTAAHVAQNIRAPAGSRWILHPRRVDVAVRELSSVEVAELGPQPDALPFSIAPERANFDIGGSVGVVLGRDSDTGRMERKVLPSLISPRVTEQFLRVSGCTRKSIARLSQKDEFQLIVLPPGEITLLSPDEWAIQGMSGSAVVYLPEGATGVEIAGILIGCNDLSVDGATYAMGHVADHVQIREAIDVLFQERTPDTTSVVPRPELRAKRVVN